ncbi:MAG: SAM-dependent methyltransferase [Caldilineaceae bacterium]
MAKEMPIPNGYSGRPSMRIIAVPTLSNLTFSATISGYLADVHTRLLSAPPARIADIDCGCGETTLDVALAYSKARIDGYDRDGAAIESAWAGARRAGVTDRVTFHVRSVTDGTLNGRYDFLISVRTLQGIEKAWETLKTMRCLLASDGIAIILANLDDAGDLQRTATNAGFFCAEVLPVDGAVR